MDGGMGLKGTIYFSYNFYNFFLSNYVVCQTCYIVSDYFRFGFM